MTPYKLAELPDFYEVRVDRDVDKGDLIATYCLIAKKENYFKKNSLWFFNSYIQPLNYKDSKEIITLIKSFYPPVAPLRIKSAFVCDSEFVRAAGEMFAKDAARLPFEIKVFDDYDQAVEWLT